MSSVGCEEEEEEEEEEVVVVLVGNGLAIVM